MKPFSFANHFNKFFPLISGLAVAVVVFGTVKVHWMLTPVMAGLLLAIPVMALVWMEERFGLYLMIGIALFMNMFLKLIPNLPIGLLIDFCILVMVLGMLYRTYWNRQWKTVFNTPLTIAIVFWVAWHLAEFVNPIAASRIAWFYVVRPALGYLLIFFVAWKHLDSLRKIKQLYTYTIFLIFISATWGVIQFINGYFPFEMNYIVQHDAVHLVFIQGRWRSFGTMGSPAHFGVVMAYSIIAAFLLMKLNFSIWTKGLFLATMIMAFFSMVFSGARSGYAVLPISILVVVLLARNIKLYVFCGVAGMALLAVILSPSNNYHIQRIQSTFHSEEDQSFNIREENRKMITPWILAHPMGGGLGSTGVWGQRFSPSTFLANFPPDSGYVRVAVEMGWIGLLLYLFLWVVILWKGGWGFLQLKNPESKTLAMALLASIVPLLAVETAQDIVGKLPSNLLFWVWLAMLFKVMALEKSKETFLTSKKHQTITSIDSDLLSNNSFPA